MHSVELEKDRAWLRAFEDHPDVVVYVRKKGEQYSEAIFPIPKAHWKPLANALKELSNG